VAGVAWLCAASAGVGLAAEGANVERVVLQLKWHHQFQFAGYYAAIERGYYREAGLEVELREATPGRDHMDAVLSGEAQYGVGNSDVLLTRAAGHPVVVLAPIFQHSPLALVARKTPEITSMHSLHDRPMMMVDSEKAEILAYFKREGVDIEGLDIRPHTHVAEDFIEGRVDAMSAYITDQPFFLREAGVPYMIFSPRSGGIDFYGDLLFSTEEQIRRRPEQVRAFLKASLRGWDYALANQEEMVDLILRKYTSIHSREHLLFEAKHTAALMHPGLIEVGHNNPGRWRHMAQTYAEFGMVPKDFDVGPMLYEPDPKPDPRVWYWALGIVSVLALGVLGWAVPLARLNRRLRAGERQYRQLAENAPFPVVISDLETARLLFVNRLAAELLGGRQEVFFSRRAVELYCDPAERVRLLADLEEADAAAPREVRLRALDGREIWTLLSAARVEFDGRRGVVVAFHDITARRVMQEELRRAKEAAEGANAMRNRYLAVMSHEIRTPMNGIHGLADLMLSDETELTGEQRENLLMMRDAAQSLMRLVTEMLDWTQLEAGAMAMDSAPVVLRDFLRHLLGLFRPATEARGVELKLEIDAEAPEVVLTDPLRLRQILSNLVSNAVKFTERGSVRLTLTAERLAGDGDWRLRFAVSDTGPGIAPEVQAKLFAPYVQADASVARHYGGSGLGLSISRGLARLLGGDIALRSELGAGSTFTAEIWARSASEAE
jgi:PAS domain S-box-containing protein